MILETIGKPSQVSLATIKDAAHFYIKYLVSTKLYNNIYLTIKFEKFDRGSHDYAYCDWMDDNHHAREFLITIDSRLNKKETLLALAHEMVHVKQYAKGEMKDIFRPTRMVKWLGERYDPKDLDYWSDPWEREARGMEMELFMKLLQFQKENET